MDFLYVLVGFALLMLVYVLAGPGSLAKRLGQTVLVWLLLGAAAYLSITMRG